MATTKLRVIKELKLASYNPASRLQDIAGLARSIQEVGLLEPIKISDRDEVIDGHRRIAAFKKMGLAEIDTITLKGDSATLYGHINSQSKKLSGNEHLRVYLANENAVTAMSRGRMQEAEEVLGRALLERMAKEGLSLATFRLANKVGIASDRTNPEMIRKIVRWLLYFGNAGIVRKAMDSGIAPGIIIAAVERNKQIRPRFDVAK